MEGNLYIIFVLNNLTTFIHVKKYYFALDNLCHPTHIYIREEEKLKGGGHFGFQLIWYLPCGGGKEDRRNKKELFGVKEIAC